MNNGYYSIGKFSILPPVVKNIIIINVLMFMATIAMQKFNIDLYTLLGLHYFESSLFYPYQFITYMFMHGNIGHLFFNMFALWMFGSVIENYWGAKRFLLYYILTGIGAALTHYGVLAWELIPDLKYINACIVNPDVETLNNLIANHQFMIDFENNTMKEGFERFKENVILLQNGIDVANAKSYINSYLLEYKDAYISHANIVGASGSVFGLLLAYGMMFPNTLIYLYFFIPIKAKWFVLAYGAIELFYGISGTADGIAHFAHLGGMIFGLILILYWRKQARKNYY